MLAPTRTVTSGISAVRYLNRHTPVCSRAPHSDTAVPTRIVPSAMFQPWTWQVVGNPRWFGKIPGASGGSEVLAPKFPHGAHLADCQYDARVSADHRFGLLEPARVGRAAVNWVSYARGSESEQRRRNREGLPRVSPGRASGQPPAEQARLQTSAPLQTDLHLCIFLVVSAVACVVTAALPPTRHESPRGALLAMEGVLELLPENSSYCTRGRLQAVTAFRAYVFNAVEDRMDAVFGNVSMASSYSGALVEDIACLVRRGGVRVQIDFLLLWRSHRNRYGTLPDVPGSKMLVGALQESLERSNSFISKFRVAALTLSIAESHRIT
ncbi:hypothetical protein ISCGN_012280 [Ixodes scapularis]